MFTYFFSLAIIAFEVICCKIFFESFCDSSGENRKYKRTILLVLLIAIYYICGFTLSKWIVLKQLCAIMSTAIIMRFYFEISLVKSAVFAILYQGLLMLVDYLVYAGNSAIVSREGIVTQEYALEGNLIIIFSKVISFLCIILIKKQFGKKSTEVLTDAECIEALLKDKEYDRAVDYVSKISKGFFKERNAINTNQVVVNAILNTKYEEAINKHIVFVFKVNDLSNIKMEDEDLVVILANLLNNAMEACENCIGKKVIKFKFMMEEQMIILSVKNTCNQMIIYHNNEIATTKMINQDEHGVGIKNIIRIVEKYNGEYVIQNDEDQFYFSIIIPL